jgi:hypothetical protein
MMKDTDVMRGTVSGVPFFAAETPPPYSAELVFRVGRVDETAATAGLSHLVEHLALPAVAGQPVDYNGSVDNLFTRFWASGEPEQVHRFLERVAASLAALPVERLATERRILLAEEAARPFNAPLQALALRFGPTGHGLPGYDELGLRRVTADEVASWAHARFTRGALALWASGTVPAGLELGLPEGRPAPAPPAPQPIHEIVFPTVYQLGPPGGVLLAFVALRSSALTVALELFEQALRDRLRYDLGLSYDISSDYAPLDGETAHVVVVADVDERDVRRWCEGAADVLDSLAANGPTEQQLDQVLTGRRRADAEPYAPLSYLWWAAAQHVLGADVETPSQLEAERDSITPAIIAGTLTEARSSLLLFGPERTPVLRGFTPYPLESPYRLDGRRHSLSGFLRRGPDRHTRLVSGREGISLSRADGAVISARYDRVVAAIRHADGSRTVLTDDGFFVMVDPSAWRDGDEIVKALDAAVATELVVDDDPDLALRTQSVRELTTGTFKRTSWIKTELRLLPDALEPGERPLVLAQATRGGFWGNIGLLCATDRRLLWLHASGSELSPKSLFLSHAEIGSIRAERDRLVIEALTDTYPIRDVEPANGATLIANTVREAQGRPGDDDLEERIAAVKELAAKTFRRTSSISGELEALPYRLEPGERLLVLATAKRKPLLLDLLALTDKRLLLLYETTTGDLEKRSLTLLLNEINEVEHDGKRLSIHSGTAKLELWDVEPAGRSAMIAQLVRGGEQS